jgi:hypothetical protein
MRPWGIGKPNMEVDATFADHEAADIVVCERPKVKTRAPVKDEWRGRSNFCFALVFKSSEEPRLTDSTGWESASSSLSVSVGHTSQSCGLPNQGSNQRISGK